MERPNRGTNPFPEDQERMERLARPGEPGPQEGSVGMSEEFRGLSKSREGRRMLMKHIASAGSPEGIKLGKPVPEDFRRLPEVKDPEGSLLKALLEDRGQGR